ncbi:Peptidyl-prolyl cis-trans isomerase CYP57 [Capsicum annuum]|nr:Peptidyl-prolyl cis-trans isomerase CYP57 [Capsicum annuum]KAF3636975.1 Peptidyl-prolyl cis-trans isomerase CYP57 [Capsicum annuum]
MAESQPRKMLRRRPIKFNTFNSQIADGRWPWKVIWKVKFPIKLPVLLGYLLTGRAYPGKPYEKRSDADDRPKVDKLSLKRKGLGSEARAELMANADTDLLLLSGPERERQLLKQKGRGRKGHEEEVLAKLEMFKAGLSAKANESVNAGKEEELSDWAAITLNFTPEPGKDKMTRSEDPNDYVVHDPLLEKGKEKFNKMMAKQKRREREWAGKSLT